MKIVFSRENIVFCSILALCSLALIPIANSATTDTQTATSNVTVNTYVSIALTTDLSNGITFGELEPNTNDNNATSCNDGACNITVSSDTNVDVQVKIKVNETLTTADGVNTIPIAGYTWAVNASATALPEVGDSNAVETDYDDSNLVLDGAPADNLAIWQGYLDVPSAQTAGVYRNLISFCAEIDGGSAC